MDNFKHSCLFLDRDGVINFDYGHVYKVDDFKFVPGIFDLVKLANRLNILVIVVTNQAGIAKGYYTINQFKKLTDWMKLEFKKNLCFINDVYFCPYHKDGLVKKYKKQSKYRKPNEGMLLKAAKNYSINLNKSLIIGDSKSDIVAGNKANLKYKLLFRNPAELEIDHIKINDFSEAEYFLKDLLL